MQRQSCIQIHNYKPSPIQQYQNRVYIQTRFWYYKGIGIYSNAFIANSLVQTLSFKSVTDKNKNIDIFRPSRQHAKSQPH